MNIIRKDLLNALKICMPGVETGNTILEGADTFIFKDGFIYSYNDNISIAAPYSTVDSKDRPCYLVGAVKAKEFFELISRIKADNIKIIIKDNKWIIKNESIRVELTVLENSLMERIEKINAAPKWSKLPERFFDGLSLCYFNSNKNSIPGIYCEKSIMTSTDEIRINWYLLGEAISEPFWISDNSAKELLKMPDIEKYCISKAWVHFQSKNKAIFSCKKLAGDYPLKMVSKIVTDNSLTKNDISLNLPKELPEAIDRAAALAMSTDSESPNSVKLTFYDDHIEIYSERPNGKYSEKVKLEKNIGLTEPISIIVDYKFFEKGIGQSDYFYIKDSKNSTRKAVFTHANGLQILNTFNNKEIA